MTLPRDCVTTNQCLKDLSDKGHISASLAKSLAREDVAFERRPCKEITSLLRRNPHNLSELILFFDGLYKYAYELNANGTTVEASALFNFLFMQFTKSDFWSVGPLKVHNGLISKFPAKKDSDVFELMVELMRIKTELEMLMEGSLPLTCAEKFNQILYVSNDKADNENDKLVNCKELAMEQFMTLSIEREERRKLRMPSSCCDCPETPSFYCRECQLYRCQLCSQKFHRSLKGTHKEIPVSVMRRTAGKSNSKLQSTIAAEQDLAFLINRDNPWNERTIQQQAKLTDTSEQIRLLRESVAKDRSPLLKGIHEDEVSKAFHLAKGDAEKALLILKRWRQKSLEILKNANVTGNPTEKLAVAQGDVAKIISEASVRDLKSVTVKIAPLDLQLERQLQDTHRDKQFRQRLTYSELFPDSPQGWERSRFLIEVLDYGNCEDRVENDQKIWWSYFHEIAFKDIVDVISKLDRFDFAALIDSETLSEECCYCLEKVNKKGMFDFSCKCTPICNECLMANMKANIARADDLLTCFEKCFKNDKEASEKEHSRLYNHLHLLSRKNQSFAEIFEKFEKLLTSKIMEDSSDTFRCPNPKCNNVWIISVQEGVKLKRRVRCPECFTNACRKCRQMWKKEHRNVRCVDYTRWLAKAFPELVLIPVPEGGGLDYPKITCPNCDTVYVLDRGGCLHFTCNKCKFEFCGFCSKPFHKPSKNPCTTCVTGKGLHAHHPRNCPFYTRDFWRDNMEGLKQLMTTHGLEMDKVLPKNDSDSGKCGITETDEHHNETKCENACEEEHQGYCHKHFVELICSEIFKNKKIDPVDIMTVDELHVVCDRENVEYEADDGVEELREELKQNCPLDDD